MIPPDALAPLLSLLLVATLLFGFWLGQQFRFPDHDSALPLLCLIGIYIVGVLMGVSF